MVKLWRCEICGDPYIGEEPPPNCPFCGAHRRYIKEAEEAEANFDVELGERDKLASLDLCTKCHPEYFYSYRRGDKKRNYALIMNRM